MFRSLCRGLRMRLSWVSGCPCGTALSRARDACGAALSTQPPSSAPGFPSRGAALSVGVDSSSAPARPIFRVAFRRCLSVSTQVRPAHARFSESRFGAVCRCRLKLGPRTPGFLSRVSALSVGVDSSSAPARPVFRVAFQRCLSVSTRVRLAHARFSESRFCRSRRRRGAGPGPAQASPPEDSPGTAFRVCGAPSHGRPSRLESAADSDCYYDDPPRIRLGPGDSDSMVPVPPGITPSHWHWRSPTEPGLSGRAESWRSLP